MRTAESLDNNAQGLNNDHICDIPVVIINGIVTVVILHFRCRCILSCNLPLLPEIECCRIVKGEVSDVGVSRSLFVWFHVPFGQ
jgi:hypothetical protein